LLRKRGLGRRFSAKSWVRWVSRHEAGIRRKDKGKGSPIKGGGVHSFSGEMEELHSKARKGSRLKNEGVARGRDNKRMEDSRPFL